MALCWRGTPSDAWGQPWRVPQRGRRGSSRTKTCSPPKPTNQPPSHEKRITDMSTITSTAPVTAPVTNVTAIAGRMKIAVLQTGAWRATRLHKSETVDVNQRHNVNVAKVMVRVTDHPALSDLTKLHAEAYAAHKRLTLPTI